MICSCFFFHSAYKTYLPKKKVCDHKKTEIHYNLWNHATSHLHLQFRGTRKAVFLSESWGSVSFHRWSRCVSLLLYFYLFIFLFFRQRNNLKESSVASVWFVWFSVCWFPVRKQNKLVCRLIYFCCIASPVLHRHLNANQVCKVCRSLQCCPKVWDHIETLRLFTFKTRKASAF